MARTMVTRTVKGTQVTLKVVDPTTEQVVEDTLILGKTFEEVNDKLKKAVVKALSPYKILVAITGIKRVDKCYGIPVADFMAQAVEIDPKTRTAFETEDAE